MLYASLTFVFHLKLPQINLTTHSEAYQVCGLSQALFVGCWWWRGRVEWVLFDLNMPTKPTKYNFKSIMHIIQERV